MTSGILFNPISTFVHVSSLMSEPARDSPPRHSSLRPHVHSKRRTLGAFFRRVNQHPTSTLDLSFGFHNDEDDWGNDSRSVFSDALSLITEEIVQGEEKRHQHHRSFHHWISKVHHHHRGRTDVPGRRRRNQHHIHRFSSLFTPVQTKVPSTSPDEGLYGTGSSPHAAEGDVSLENLDGTCESCHMDVVSYTDELTPFTPTHLSLTDFSSTLDELDLPPTFYSPVHAVNYEELEELKLQFFDLPEFTNSIEVIAGNSTTTITDGGSGSTIVPSPGSAEESLTATERQVEDQDSMLEEASYYCDEDVLLSPPTPELVRQMFVEDGDLQSPLMYNLVHSVISKSSPSSESFDPTAQDSANWYIQPGASTTLQRARSLLEKMRSAFVHVENQESALLETETILSTDSNYTPVPVAVPTLRNDSLIADLVGTISQGILIEPLYHPEMVQDPSDTFDENTPIGILDPQFFAPIAGYSLMTSVGLRQVPSSPPVKYGSIKFDTFAEVLFYNGSSSIKSKRSSATVTGSGYNKPYKRYGDLALQALSSNTRRLSFSKLSTLSLELTKAGSKTGPKSILKVRENKNEDVETVKIAESDNVDVQQFLDLFNYSELQRQESVGLLENIRDQQLASYYDSVDEHHAKQITLLDSL